MSAVRSVRWLAATCVAAVLCFIPVGITPAGTLEVEGACASADCRDSFGMMCLDGETGAYLLDHKPVNN